MGRGRSIAIGFILGLLFTAVSMRATTVETLVRVGASDRLVFDARVDESPVGRVTNLPTAVLGEARFTKRSWLLATIYGFTLDVRPEVVPGVSRAVGDLQVAVTLPGQVTRTNATRVADRVAVWERLPVGPLRAQTRAVHWWRVLLVAAVLAASIIYRPRS